MKIHSWLPAVFTAAILCFCLTACGSTQPDITQSGTTAETTTDTAARSTENTETSADTEAPETSSVSETESETAPAKESYNDLGVETLAEGIYSLDFRWDYKLDEYLSANVKTTEELDRWFMENLTDGLSTEGSEYNIACSSFAVTDTDGEHLFCRNYDLRHTDDMFIRTAPENGYASIGIVDLAHLNIGQECEAAIDSAEAQSLLLAAPYCICDGINEKGLGVSLLQLDTEHFVTDTEKPDLLVYTALRAMLDKCADTDEAVEFLSAYDIYSPAWWSYHIFITDKSGRAVTVEWLEDGQTVVEDNAVTNFVLYEAPPTRDPDGRYFKLRKALDPEEGISGKEEAMALLETVSQKPGTNWSAVYDLDDFKVEACFALDYENKYEFDGNSGQADH
ncbi:MAG: linear amide C-N hydrolase [Oscillospiraceae bacterium]|nr:linear amide C-N hydrolase [Oscillospiraceae bacterium]